MSHELKGLYKFGGISFIISGVLFFLKYVLDLMAGSPPPSGAAILAWVASGKLPLALANEVLFFAAGFLIPAVVALYYSLVSTDRTKAVLGCGIIAVTIPVIFVLLIVHGRLVFPVYDISVNTSDIAEFAVALYYGGLHATLELLGFATIIVSLAMRRGVYGRNIAYLGFVAGVFDIIGAYPYLIGPILILVSQVLFSGWFVAVGAKLYGIR